MKFTLDNIDAYDGSDLIFMMGAPGSRWSQVYRVIGDNPAINNSDWSEERNYAYKSLDVFDQVTFMGNHAGVYFGPGNGFGEKFDRINTLTKAEIVAEFMRPFTSWDRIKIIKSHCFSYHIEFLCSLFPRARLLFCYSNAQECFYRWHKCGGWSTLHGNYSWYENDVRMLEKIKEENYHILSFCADRNLELKHVPRSVIWSELGIPHAADQDHNFKCKVSVYKNDYMGSFHHLSPHEISIVPQELLDEI